MALPSFLFLALLFSVARAADKLEVDSSKCAVKGAEGDFSYDPTSSTGPGDWGDLSSDFETCSLGSSQSPINFPLSVSYAPRSEGPKPSISVGNMSYSPTSYNWALSCEGDCGYTMFAGQKFKLINLHLHAPSEHTLNGRQYPLEAHMVHISDAGDLAVIATMFDYPSTTTYQSQVAAGANKDYGVNSLVKEVMRGVMKNKGTFKVHLGSILNPGKGYCVYSGGLTTPPCTEGVTFLMAQNVETVSRRQVFDYSASCGVGMDGNNRPLQPLNGRVVTCYVA